MKQEKSKQTKTGNIFDLKLLLRLLKYTKSYKTTYRWAAFLTIFLAFLAPVTPLLIQYTVDNFVLTTNLEMLVIFTLIMVGVLLLQTGVQFFQLYTSGLLGQSIIRDMRNQLLKHLAFFRLQFFDRMPIGVTVTRVVNDMETIARIFSEGLLSIIGDLLKLIVILIVMLVIDWQLTLICLIPVPLLLIATNVFKNGIKKTFQAVRTEVANLNTFTQEHITGMNLIQAFNREAPEMEKFKTINRRHRKAHVRSVWYYSIFFPIVEILSAISIALVVWWGAWQFIRHPELNASPGKIISFILFVYMFYRPMRQIADRFNVLQMGIVASDRIFTLLDREETAINKGKIKADNINGKIEFKKVNFAYSPKEYVLENISFHIAPGETLAIVGATGSGKTTIINLLSRLYEVEEGHILIDGVDLKDYELESLHQKLATVSQDVFLFSDSIANNIRLNNPDISQAAIEEAAKAVGAHRFINKLPGGYYYNVRERGGMLSVGQRQLISFIRAYVYNPRILILDEATSSIDTESELLIQKATEKITKGRTAIIIAHRLSTIQKADKILVLENGQIMEMDRHNELLTKNGHYKKLFDLQFGALVE